MLRAILFDLDDTLYDEGEYVASGFRAVAAAIAQQYGQQAEDIFQTLQSVLQRNGRGRVFDATLENYGITPTPETVSALVQAYREHLPDIRPFPDVEDSLSALAAKYRLALVTDGLPIMQRRKVLALGMAQRVGHIVYCWEHQAPKPDVTGFQLALNALGVTASEAVVVGDRPDHDLAAAQVLGCAAVRIRRGRYAQVDSHPYKQIAELADLQTLPEVLEGYAQQTG